MLSVTSKEAVVCRRAIANVFAAYAALAFSFDLANAEESSSTAVVQSRISKPVRPAFDIQAYDVDGNSLLDQQTIETAVYPFAGPNRSREDVDPKQQAGGNAFVGAGVILRPTSTMLVNIAPALCVPIPEPG